MDSFKHLCRLLSFCAFIVHAAPAVAIECAVGSELIHAFDSGASWNFCVVLDDDHALELQEIHYQAPGDISRKVLQHLHLGQILLHNHDQTEVQSLISNSSQLGGAALSTLNASICPGELHELDQQRALLCSTVRPTGLLAKYNLRPGLQGEQYQLFSVSTYQGYTFQIQVGLSEDGRIAPSIILSGQSKSTTDNTLFGNAVTNPITGESVLFSQSSLLYTWRMVFALNGDQTDDAIDEFNFQLDEALGSRRPMQIDTITTEALRTIDRDAFRGWRIRDVDGRGYYLDPQNSGFRYKDLSNNWTGFDIAITAFDACERHSRIESAPKVNNITECAGSLDDFVNGQSTENAKSVIWYSLSRVHRPSSEDFPIISSMTSDFEIIPFDWTPTSPFEVLGE